MNINNPELEAAYRQVRALLSQLYGESARADTRAPVFWIAYGSAEVGISVEVLQGQRVYTRVFAWVVTGPRVDADLMQYLLNANRNMRLGAFAIDQEGDVEFAWGLADTELSVTSLRSGIQAVMQTADEFGSLIKEQFGGLRAIDRMRAAQPPVDFDRELEEAGLRLPPVDESGKD
ncbi:MAG: T3SS (YopN, CesT) and YbjN peptide-binding chaperone 1 [Solirubrobacteraceae bacterium]